MEEKLDPLVGQADYLDSPSTVGELSVGSDPHEFYQQSDLVASEIIG